MLPSSQKTPTTIEVMTLMYCSISIFAHPHLRPHHHRMMRLAKSAERHWLMSDVLDLTVVRS
jgi:hypothetical protein